MRKIQLVDAKSEYKNKGIKAQINYIYTKSGRITKHDNIKHTLAADFEDVQVKSPKCSFTSTNIVDIEEYLVEDKANTFAFVIDLTAYEMSKTEYIAFVKAFSYVSRESAKNGGHAKLRCKDLSKSMVEWLEERAN